MKHGIYEGPDGHEAWWAGEKVTLEDFNGRLRDQMKEAAKFADGMQKGMELAEALDAGLVANAKLQAVEEILERPICGRCRAIIAGPAPAPSSKRVLVEDIHSADGHFKLVEAYTKAYWADGGFKRTLWMGIPCLQLPEDMVAFAEVLWRVQPDVVIECGVYQGGTSIFLASILDILGKGSVVAVDVDLSMAGEAKVHPLSRLIEFIEGSSTDPRVVARVAERCKTANRVVVLLDSDHSKEHVAAELEIYSKFVRLGGQLIVMDGVMQSLHDVPGGRPEWASDNPEMAIREFLPKHPEFQRDLWYNRFWTTHGPGGFLRRVR